MMLATAALYVVLSRAAWILTVAAGLMALIAAVAGPIAMAVGFIALEIVFAAIALLYRRCADALFARALAAELAERGPQILAKAA